MKGDGFMGKHCRVLAMKKIVWGVTAAVIGLAVVSLSCGPVIKPKDAEVRDAGNWTPQKLEQDWDAFLKKHVSAEGLVNYEGVVADSEELEKIYAQVARFSPENSPQLFTTEEERFAYWLNAYNIAAIRGVSERYPIASVLDVKPFSVFSLVKKGGFFVGQKFVFGGQKMHLYKLENVVIREGFGDPRLHFALNCASESCPPLSREAFQGARLEEQLDKLTRDFVNSARAYQIDDDKKEIALSEIFDWYREDFVEPSAKDGEVKGEVLDYLEKYLRANKLSAFKQARQQGYQLTYQPYDWSLNDSRKKPTAP